MTTKKPTNLWSVWAGRKEETIEAKDLAWGTTSVFWDNIPDLRTFPNRTGVEECLLSRYTDQSAEARHRAQTDSTSLWMFYQDIKPGDWIIMPMRNPSNYFSFGQVRPLEEGGEYAFNPRRPGHHQRQVRWFYPRIPERILLPDINATAEFRRPATVTPIYLEDGAERILAACDRYVPGRYRGTTA